MGSEQPRKKLSFFNGGRGVDFSEYGEQEEPEIPLGSGGALQPEGTEATTEDSTSYPMSPYYSPSPAEPLTASSTSHSHQPEYSPLQPSTPPYSPQPSIFLQTSRPTYISPTYNPGELSSHSHSHLPVGFPHHLPGHHPFQPHVFPHSTLHAPNPLHNPHFATPPPLFPEAGYSGLVGASGGYNSLMPMEQNGLHSMAISEPPFIMETNEAGTKESEGSKKKRQQKCSVCINHGIQVDVRGHKWFCPFRNCNCDRCSITRGRQHHMKEQQKLTRHLQRMQ